MQHVRQLITSGRARREPALRHAPHVCARPLKRVPRCAWLLACALLLTLPAAPEVRGVAPGTPGADGSTEPVIRILQFNMCGAARGAGCVSQGRSGQESAVPAIVASILDTRKHAPRPGRPDVVTLNEACRTQIDAIVQRLSTAGYRMHA